MIESGNLTEEPRLEDNALPDALIKDHGDYLYAYALRYFRDSAIAEDLVQDTLLAAIQSWDRFEGGSTRRTWLVSILRHKIFDHLRKKSRRQETPITEGEAEMSAMFGFAYGMDEHWLDERAPSSWSDSPERLVEQKQFLGEVERCLSQLPERLRHAFLLRELDDCTGAEVSKELGVTEGNARVLLHRARLLLRDCLEMSWFKRVP